MPKKEAAFTIIGMKTGKKANPYLADMDPKKLLRNKRVIEEINRHKWLESEIAGYDIGFEAATEDWLKKHASAWIEYHDNNKAKPPVKFNVLPKKRSVK